MFPVVICINQLSNKCCNLIVLSSFKSDYSGQVCWQKDPITRFYFFVITRISLYISAHFQPLKPNKETAKNKHTMVRSYHSTNFTWARTINIMMARTVSQPTGHCCSIIGFQDEPQLIENLSSGIHNSTWSIYSKKKRGENEEERQKGKGNEQR